MEHSLVADTCLIPLARLIYIRILWWIRQVVYRGKPVLHVQRCLVFDPAVQISCCWAQSASLAASHCCAVMITGQSYLVSLWTYTLLQKELSQTINCQVQIWSKKGFIHVQLHAVKQNANARRHQLLHQLPAGIEYGRQFRVLVTLYAHGWFAEHKAWSSFFTPVCCLLRLGCDELLWLCQNWSHCLWISFPVLPEQRLIQEWNSLQMLSCCFLHGLGLCAKGQTPCCLCVCACAVFWLLC